MTDTISAFIQALNRVVWGAPALPADSGSGAVFQPSHPVFPGAEAGLFSRYHLAQAAGEAGDRRRLTLPGRMHRFGCNRRHWQHRRCGRGHCHWWTRRHFLDVGGSSPGHGSQICRGGPGRPVPGTGRPGSFRAGLCITSKTVWAKSGPGWVGSSVPLAWWQPSAWATHPDQHRRYQHQRGAHLSGTHPLPRGNLMVGLLAGALVALVILGGRQADWRRS